MIKNLKMPDVFGKYGSYGGKFVPETLIAALDELGSTYQSIKKEKKFLAELSLLQKEYNGRPTPLTFASRLTDYF